MGSSLGKSSRKEIPSTIATGFSPPTSIKEAEVKDLVSTKFTPNPPQWDTESSTHHEETPFRRVIRGPTFSPQNRDFIEHSTEDTNGNEENPILAQQSTVETKRREKDSQYFGKLTPVTEVELSLLSTGIPAASDTISEDHDEPSKWTTLLKSLSFNSKSLQDIWSRLQSDLKQAKPKPNLFIVAENSFSDESNSGNGIFNTSIYKDCSNQLDCSKSLKSSGPRALLKNIQNHSNSTKTVVKKSKCSEIRGMNRTNKISESIVKKSLPSHWDCHCKFPMPECQLVYLPEDHSEFLDVKRNMKCLKSRKVLTVARVENPYLYCMYQLKRLELILDGSKCEEIQLFHGTKTENVNSIVMDNFDWRRHGTNVGERNGQGVSFSPLISFASYYAKNSMFVVRVLVTNCSTGTCHTVLPKNGSDTTKRPDGKVYVKFDDNTFYPEYLVTLSTKKH